MIQKLLSAILNIGSVLTDKPARQQAFNDQTIDLTRRLFLLGSGAAILTGCANNPTGAPPVHNNTPSGGLVNGRPVHVVEDSRQLYAAQTREEFEGRVNYRVNELINEFQDIIEEENTNALASRHFQDVVNTGYFRGLDNLINNSNIPLYSQDILRGYEQPHLIYSQGHIEATALTLAAAANLRHPNFRVRSYAAYRMAQSYARAFSDIFGGNLQTAIENGTINSNNIVEICGRSAPDGLGWAYQVSRYAAQLIPPGGGLLQGCSMLCRPGRTFRVQGNWP